MCASARSRALAALCVFAIAALLVSCGDSSSTPSPQPTTTMQAVRGVVTDSLNTGFAGASVSMSGSAAVTPATTGADGSFSLQAQSGTYTLSVSHNSRTVVTRNVTVASAAVDVGTIRMPKPSLNGVVNDHAGKPVSGARIEVNTTTTSRAAMMTFGFSRRALMQTSAATSVVTGADGSFTLQLDPGNYGLSVSLQNMVLLDTNLVVAQAPYQQLTPFVVSTDFNADTDSDGLADVVETNGWDILIDEFANGTLTTRHVTGDSTVADSDHDGLSDAAEYAYKTDPRRADTDGDGLSDSTELNAFFSHPASVDSDADSRGPSGTGMPNPRLFDGAEVNRPCPGSSGGSAPGICATSPVLADTDGDGLTDYEEIIGGGFNPLRADLPNVQIDVAGDPVAVLNIDFEGNVESKSVQALLQSERSERVATDTRADKFSLESDIKSELGINGVKYNASSSWEFKSAVALEASHTTSATAARESQKNLEETIGRNEVRRYRDGTLSVPMRLRNNSDLSVNISSLSIVASRIRPSTYGATSLVGTLAPKDFPQSGWNLSPGSDVLFEATNEALNGLLIQPVIANPGAMQFELGVLQMHQVDSSGTPIKDFSAVGQSVLERCGLVVIDYGNGRVERHAIATNVFRNPDGSSSGINLLQALKNVAGLEVDVAQDPRYVRRIGTVSSDSAQGKYWAIVGEGSEFTVDSSVSFERLTLHHGQRITLMYQADNDNDGLPDREEVLLGTSPVGDTDGDGLSDWDEVKTGWDVAFRDISGNIVPGLSRRVFSDPRSPDADGDGLNDLQERAAVNRDPSDPNLPDTDNDGTSDPLDTVADAQEIAGPPRVGLARYYPLDYADKYTGSAPTYGTPYFIKDHAGTGTDVNFVSSTQNPPYNSRHCYTEPFTYGDWLTFQPFGVSFDYAGLYSFANRENVLKTAAYFFFNYNQTSDMFGNADYPCAAMLWGKAVRADEVAIGGSVTLSVWLYLDPRKKNDTDMQSPRMYDLAWDPAADPGWSGYAVYDGRFSLDLRSGKIYFRYQTGAGQQDIVEVADPDRLERRRWHHYTGVFDANTSTAKLYRNGILIARAVRTLDLAGISIGRYDFGIGAYTEFRGDQGVLVTHPHWTWKGGIDEVRIYNRALSDDEVVRLSQDSGPTTTQ